jgi:glycosyltransferase involved in cell wall biosynthesis
MALSLAKFPQLRRNLVANYSLLSTDPLIFYAPGFIDPYKLTSFDILCNFLRENTVYLLCGWRWDAESPSDIETIKEIELQHYQKYPQHKVIHLCNTSGQADLFKESGLRVIFSNQNALADEKIFKPDSDLKKKFDAVYDATPSPYKRHYLASGLDSIALIYYPLSEELHPNVHADVEKFKRDFAHAHFFNTLPTGEYRPLKAREVSQCLNACRVGLCLSAIEGAMFASIQYLLCGLPVVSTKSKGGRDVFFDDEYVLIVDDHPDAVREGVKELIQRDISAGLIRSKTLEKIKPHRKEFIGSVQEIYRDEGVDRNFEEEWDSIFYHRLVRSQNHAEMCKKLAELGI